jgi:hypothetical protein
LLLSIIIYNEFIIISRLYYQNIQKNKLKNKFNKIIIFSRKKFFLANNFRVSECNATRVLPKTNDGQMSKQFNINSNLLDHSSHSVPLLDSKGCSLHPQIMGNMRRVNGHLEATLIAFRIDGGSELDM